MLNLQKVYYVTLKTEVRWRICKFKR